VGVGESERGERESERGVELGEREGGLYTSDKERRAGILATTVGRSVTRLTCPDQKPSQAD